MDRAKQQTGRAGAAAAERRAKGDAAMRQRLPRGGWRRWTRRSTTSTMRRLMEQWVEQMLEDWA